MECFRVKWIIVRSTCLLFLFCIEKPLLWKETTARRNILTARNMCRYLAHKKKKIKNYWLLIESSKKMGDEHVCLHFTELALWTLHILALSYLALSEFAGAVLLTSQCLRRNLVLSVLWEKILADLLRRKPLQSLKDKKWENIFLRSLPGLF